LADTRALSFGASLTTANAVTSSSAKAGKQLRHTIPNKNTHLMYTANLLGGSPTYQSPVTTTQYKRDIRGDSNATTLSASMTRITKTPFVFFSAGLVCQSPFPITRTPPSLLAVRVMIGY